MKYLVYGAGGTGGCLAAFLAQGGQDVSLIARGAHLSAIQEHGLVLETGHGTFAIPLPACTQEEYTQTPDVIFLCVKGYGLEGVIPTLQRLCTPDTVVVPILNLFDTGERLQQHLPNTLVTDGCMYIAAEIKCPGTIHMSGDIFRVVFGPRDLKDLSPKLEQIAADLNASGVEATLSRDIRRDALQKFSVVSPMAACGIYHDVKVGAMQHPGPIRDDFAALVGEVAALAAAMGHPLLPDTVERSLAIQDALDADASTSLKRDLDAGKPSEVDGLIFQVVRLGRKYGVPTPTYDRTAAKLGFPLEEAL